MSDPTKPVEEWVGCMCDNAHDGVILVHDMQGDEVWLSPVTFAEPCGCVSNDQCPRCGSKIVPNPASKFTDDLGKCSSESCGWTWEHAVADADDSPSEP
jgi:hypothetical protein